jgi:hypothetical protein
MLGRLRGILRAIWYWRRQRRISSVYQSPPPTDDSEARLARVETALVTLSESVASIAAASLATSELARQALATPRSSPVGGSLLTVNMGGSGGGWMLNLVVYAWLTLALVVAGGFMLRMFSASTGPALDLDILERVIGWVGLPAGIIIVNEVQARREMIKAQRGPDDTD